METWTFDWAIRNLIAELLMPPGIWILLLSIAFFFFRKLPKLKISLVLLSLVMMWVTSTSIFSKWLIDSTAFFMDWPKPVLIKSLSTTSQNIQKENPVQAIIVLGGGRRLGAKDSAEYFDQDLSKESLERVRMAAKLAKHTGLPILTSGGQPDATDVNHQAEAQIMSWVLKKEYELDVKWVEGQSNTTQENALYSFRILNKESINHIYLVTHYWHMPRAKNIFEKQGFRVTAIPHGFFEIERYTPLDFYPSGQGMVVTRQVWHELLGSAWYRIRY